MSDKKLSRRDALRLGVGAIAGATIGVAEADSGNVTPHQTEGPFFPKSRRPDEDTDLTQVKGRAGKAQGKVIRVSGVVRDNDGNPVSGALIDVWQANVHGRYDHEDDPNPAPLDPNFQSWAKMVTREDGSYSFKTIVPGAYKVQDSWSRPPHIHFKIAKRGYHELTTQMYFAGQPLNKKDSILQELSAEEQAMLVVAFAPPVKEPTVPAGKFDILIKKV